MIYADNFGGILDVFSNNTELRARALVLIQTKPLCCKVLEEKERADAFREILASLVNREIQLINEAYEEVKIKLPRETSKYKLDSVIFVNGWNEKAIRLHLSRFYNHAVLENLSQKGVKECFIPDAHSASDCRLKTNYIYKVDELLGDMIKCFDMGCSDAPMKIPEHPDCPHVVKPLEYMNPWRC